VLITEEQKEEVDINSIDALNQKMNKKRFFTISKYADFYFKIEMKH